MKFRRAVRYHLLKFLRLRGTPIRVALGFALGACINFYPTFGAGVVVAGLLATALRLNIAAAFLGDLTFKSLFPVFFYFNLLTGDFILGRRSRHLVMLMHKMFAFRHINFADWRFFGTSFMLGAIINTLFLGTLLFILVHLLFARYRPSLMRFVYHLKK